MNNFNDMFYKGVDNSERAFKVIDTISVLNVHKWNWDSFIQESVIYAFINYWKMYGKDMLETYRELPYERRKRIYIGLDICYKRIMENKDIFFGDTVVNKCNFVNKTLDFIWKYKFVMWD